ncbi:uncharacterized protein M6B38_408760 [Iris pallida]|uniref:Uncharacterized protein n=1 Tax=Iris pallida TaxID=29817 RepID=A0AAX6FMZ6_IRIPA|nr:uncharacterized protein M6B38_408760 [Iris pallida]
MGTVVVVLGLRSGERVAMVRRGTGSGYGGDGSATVVAVVLPVGKVVGRKSGGGGRGVDGDEMGVLSERGSIDRFRICLGIVFDCVGCVDTERWIM